MSELTVVVRLTAKPNKAGDLERALRSAAAPTHREPGCIRYAIHRSSDDQATFLLVERWVSAAALDQHLQMPYLQELLAKTEPLLAKPADVGRYELVPEGMPEKLL